MTYRHIMTGFAAYYNLTWGIWLRYCLNGTQDEVELVWPSLFTSVPTVVRRKNLGAEKKEN
jgi:dihydroceramidase